MSDIEDQVRSTARHLFAAGGAVVTLDRLVEMGWHDLVAVEPAVAVATLAEEQGRSLGTSRLAELEMDRVLGLDPAAVALALAPADVLLADAADAPAVAFVAADPERRTISVVAGADVARIAVTGIDPAARWTRASGTGEVLPLDDELWTAAVAAGSLAVAHELIGVAAAMLEIGVRHTTDRHQFGVPIATFQAVQHRLAEVHVRVEAARAVARTAWIDGDPAMCSAALAAARTATGAATEHVHQVMGAIGCTWEHDLHRYIRRGVLLSLLLDPGPVLRRAIHPDALARPPVEVLA